MALPLPSLACATQRTLQPDTPLLVAGQTWREAVHVDEGVIRLCLTDRAGREFNKAFFLAGQQCFPLTASLRNTPSRFAILSVGTCRLRTAPMERLIRTMDAGQWQRASMRALERLLDDKLEREHVLLTLDATARYRWLRRTHPDWLDAIPLKHLASYLGMTDVSLSRIRRNERANAVPASASAPESR